MMMLSEFRIKDLKRVDSPSSLLVLSLLMFFITLTVFGLGALRVIFALVLPIEQVSNPELVAIIGVHALLTLISGAACAVFTVFLEQADNDQLDR